MKDMPHYNPACRRIYRRAKTALLIFFGWILLCASASAHHVLGRPSYNLSEDSTTPPSAQIEVILGAYQITFMAFPAFPKPEEQGRLNLYIAALSDDSPFQGEVTFSVRDDSWFNFLTDGNREIIGRQSLDGQVFRQGFIFKETGDYLVTASFESGGEPYKVDFPLRVGTPPPVGPVGLTIAVLMLVLIGVNIINRKRLGRVQISRRNPRLQSDGNS